MSDEPKRIMLVPYDDDGLTAWKQAVIPQKNEVEYRHHDTVKALTAERDQSRRDFGHVLNLIPTSELDVTATVDDTIDYFKGVIAERDALRKAIIGITYLDGPNCVQNSWKSYENLSVRYPILLELHTPPKETP